MGFQDIYKGIWTGLYGPRSLVTAPVMNALVVNDDGSINAIVTVTPPTSSTGTESNVASSATDVTILAANASRKGATIFNDSTAVLYILNAVGTSSVTNYTVQLQPLGYYEMPFGYIGVVKGFWASANGFARVTEST